MRRAPLLLFISLLVWGAARTGSAAEEPSPSMQADAFVKALAAKDAATLRALAATKDPDPWLVVESMLVRGLSAEARAFSAQATVLGTKGLGAYVDAHTEVASRAGKGPVTRLLAAYTEAMAFHHAKAYRKALPIFEQIAKEATSLGWLTRASLAEYRAGLALYELADYRGARARFARQLALEVQLGSKVGQGRGQYRVALQDLILGNETEAWVGLAKSLRAAVETKDSLYVSKGQTEIAMELFQSDRVQESVPVYELAWAAMESIDDSNLAKRHRASHRDIVFAKQGALLNLASTHGQLNELDKARHYARQAVRFSRKAGVEQALLSARAFLASFEGSIAASQGLNSAAFGYLSQASELYERLGNADQSADALRRLASARSRLADFPGALEDITRAIAILEPTGAQRPLFEAHVVATFACLALGRVVEAAKHAKTATGIATKLADPQLRIRALLAQASVVKADQDLDQAVRLLHRAQRIHRAHKNTDITAVELLLGRLEFNAGDYKAALERAQRLLAATTAYGNVGTILDLRRLAGGSHAMLGHLDEALAEYEVILATSVEAGHVAEQASVLNEMASICTRGQRYAQAIALARKGIGLAIRARDREMEVLCRLQLGQALLRNKELERAIEEVLFAVEIAEELRISIQAHALGQLCEVHYYRSEFAEAIARAHECVALGRAYGLSMSEDARAQARSTFARGARWGLAAAVDLNRGADIYQFVERMRAQSVVVSLGGRHRLRNAHVARKLRTAEDEARAAAALAYDLWMAETRRPERARRRAARIAYEQALEKERDAVADVQQAVRQAARLQDTNYGSTLAFSEAVALCGKGDALVLFGDDGMDYVAIVIMPKGSATIRLGRRAAVDDAMAALSADPNATAAAATLRNLIYDPLKLPARVTRVIVSPAGKMAYLPFAALDPSRSFAMVPSATAWAALRAQRVEAGSKILALADPAYERQRAGAPPLKTTLRGRVFAPLPASRLEAEGIGSHTRLLGSDATETRLRAILQEKGHWKSIHLACHGIVDDHNPTRSALVLAWDKQNDGFLHANEIHEQLHLSTELVVLSACETGRGRIYRGEGLLGLSRAFMLAGAPRILCSLWKVDDESTSALMVKFYELWNPAVGSDGKAQAGLPPAQALQLAQAHVRATKKWADPHHWAGWVLWGLPD